MPVSWIVIPGILLLCVLVGAYQTHLERTYCFACRAELSAHKRDRQKVNRITRPCPSCHQGVCDEHESMAGVCHTTVPRYPFATVTALGLATTQAKGFDKGAAILAIALAVVIGLLLWIGTRLRQEGCYICGAPATGDCDGCRRKVCGLHSEPKSRDCVVCTECDYG